MDNDKQITDMQQLAETGWKQMHEMLRQQGLSSDITVVPLSAKKRNLFAIYATCILLVLIFTAPFILNKNNREILNPKLITEKLSPGQEASTLNLSVKNNIPVKSPATILEEKISLHKKINADFLKFKTTKAPVIINSQKVFSIQPVSTQKISEIPTPKFIGRADSVVKEDTSNHLPVLKKPKNPVSKKVQFFAGAGINVPTLGNKPNAFSFDDFNIHPGITVIIPLSEKLSLHSGLWAFSTVHGKEVSTKEKELVNNVSGNLYYNINTTSIIKASYFDVPVTVHYSVNKNWSVGSGLQLSKLYKINIIEEKESFDYSNTLFSASVAQFNSTPTRAAAVFQKKVIIKKYEPRFIAETNFHHGKWLFSAGYYYGLGKTITLREVDNSTHQYRNEYFKFGIQYNLKGK
jgi:hypothetical protein